jgi:peroxiredoxin
VSNEWRVERRAGIKSEQQAAKRPRLQTIRCGIIQPRDVADQCVTIESRIRLERQKEKIVTKKRAKYQVAATLLILGVSSLATGQELGKKQTEDEKIKEVVRNFARYVQQLPGSSVVVTSIIHIDNSPLSQKTREVFSIAMQRPNRLAVVHKKGTMGPMIVCDGEKIATYHPQLNQYVLKPAPSKFDDIFGRGSEAGTVIQQAIPLLDVLLANDPYELFFQGIQNSQYLGTETVNETNCHHLKYTKDTLDWHLWVEVGKKPLLRKIAAEIVQTTVRAKFEWEFSNWVVDNPAGQERFQFEPPPGSRAVRKFGENKLIGQPAPNFKAALVDGGQMELAQHKGKHIVILDFWAVRCPPCRAALPVISKIAQDYKNKGVVLYAVNEEDGPDKIRQFLESIGVKAAAAMPKRGFGTPPSQLYEVEGIPQTVVIGKKGMIQSIHSGYHDGLGDQLIEELEMLLSGRDVAIISKREKEKGTFDLVCQKITFTPMSPKENKPFTFSCLLKNKGTATVRAGSYKIGLMIGRQQVYMGTGRDDLPGGTETVYSVNSSNWSLAMNKADTYPFITMVDPDNVVSETDESNNMLTGELKVIK